MGRLFDWILIWAQVNVEVDANWKHIFKIGTILWVFSGQYINLLGHVLLVERMIATLLVHRYEQLRTPIINAVWFIALVIFCFRNVKSKTNY